MYIPKCKRFLQCIFSIKNQDTKKICTILGINFCYDMTKEFEPYKMLPVQNNKIVFCNSKGKRGYGCNPKYIAEEIIKRRLPYELVWLVDKHSKNIDFSEFPSQIRLVDFRSKEALKELATAKVWIDNQAKIYHTKKGLNKKKEQLYIQTWHGSLGIKKIGQDSSVDISNKYRDITIRETSFIDYLLSNSKLEDRVYAHRFPNVNILKIGHTRNDVFYKTQEETLDIKNKVCKLYNIDTDTKIILYAPTFRNNLKNNDCYDIDYLRILNTFEKKYNCNFVICTRLHHEMKNLNLPKSDKIIDVTKYGDIQELMLVSDFMLSDYSSGMFDFMLSGKPCFIFARDLEEYANTQGFYYPLESTPFPIALDNDMLIENILNFNDKEYKNKVEVFLKEKGCVENGHASEKVVNLITRSINV